MAHSKENKPAWKLWAPKVQSNSTAVVWTVQAWVLVALTFLSFFPRMFHLEEMIFFVFLVVALGTAWLEGREVWVRNPIDLPLLLFVGWVLLTIPFSIDPAYSFGEWRKLVAPVLAFYWALLVIRTQAGSMVHSAILGTVVIAIVVHCSYALIEFVAQGGTWKNRGIRAVAPFSGFQELTTYMVMAIPLLVAAVVISRTWWQRIVSYGAVVFALLTQVFSYTRAGWLGMLAQAVGFGMFTRRRGIIIALLVGFTVGCLGLLVVYQMGYHKGTFDPWTLNVRFTVWERGVQEMLKHPILGLGYGNDTFQIDVKDLAGESHLRHSHNTFLMVGVGSGWPALILLVWVFVEAARSLLSQASKVSDALSYGLMVGTAIMILGFAVRNLFDYMFKGSLAYLFLILLAVGLANCVRTPKIAKK